MKKYLPVVVVAILIAAGAGLALTRDSANEIDTGEEQSNSTSNENTNNTQTQNTNQTSNNSSEATGRTAVTIENFAYVPQSITVKVGTTVTWTNKDSVAHTVTSDSGGVLDSPLFSAGETYSFTFNEAGTFTYHCTPHPDMKGTVTVTQ